MNEIKSNSNPREKTFIDYIMKDTIKLDNDKNEGNDHNGNSNISEFEKLARGI